MEDKNTEKAPEIDYAPLKYGNVKERREYYKERVRLKVCDNILEDSKAGHSSKTGFLNLSYYPK